MKWLLVCDPGLPVEEYGDVLAGVPTEAERAGCPAGYRAVYLDATLEQVRPLTSDDARVCRILPVWQEPQLSSAELLVLSRRVERAREAEEQGSESETPGEQRE